MRYGIKRGVKPDGEYGLMDVAGLALAGSAGIIAALVTDYQQQGEASALYTINQWVVSASRMFGMGDVPLWAIVVGLVALGAASVFYFQPLTRHGAFAQGFGLLAVMMTAVPSDLGGSIQAARVSDGLLDLEPIAYSREAAAPQPMRLMTAAYVVDEPQARVHLAQSQQAARYDVTLVINFPNGLPEDLDSMIRRGTIRGRLHNADTGSTFNLFRSAGGSIQRSGNQLLIRAGVPARSENATLWVRIECERYTIEEQSTRASTGQPLTWRINMQPSNTPLVMQRLNKSYWF